MRVPRTLTLFLSAFALACAEHGPTACEALERPHILRRWEPLVAKNFRISAEWSRLEPGGVLVMLADPDTPDGAGLPLTGRILLRIATAEGDTEEVQGMNFVCLQTLQCTGVVLRMTPGRSARDLARTVSCIPARLTNVSPSGDTAVVRVFDDRMRDVVIPFLRSLDGVESADTLAITPGTSRWLIVASVPVTDHLVARDGAMRVAEGQELNVSVLPPPGLGLRADARN